METTINCRHDFSVEIRTQPNTSGEALHHENIMEDLPDLIEETYVRGVLCEKLPMGPAPIEASLTPKWLREPVASEIEVQLSAHQGGESFVYRQSYSAGRWSRRCLLATQQFREEGVLTAEQTAYLMLLATNGGELPTIRPPALQPPAVADQTLADLGVRDFGDGKFAADRPVLVNSRMVDDIVRLTEQAGVSETGGGTLGKIVRLPERLPGANTRIVTVLTTSMVDPRHTGTLNSFAYNPDALAEADQIAQLRGLGESVLTAFHSHGWGTSCGDCNQSDKCVIPQCTVVSVQDYQVVDSLFPSKSTLLPIAGRKLGASGRHPVLEVHAWRGGQLRPIAWRRYQD